MKYSEAEAMVKKLAHDPGYMKITLSYNTYIIVPHADGIKILEALGRAEYLETPYSTHPVIRPVGVDDLPINLMSAQERRQLHMAQLLRVPVCELARVEAEEKPPPF